MDRRDLGQRDRVKYFTASTQPRISQDSETEFSSIESRVSSKQNIAVRKVKTSVRQGSPVDSSPWDTDEDNPSNKVKKEMRTFSKRKRENLQKLEMRETQHKMLEELGRQAGSIYGGKSTVDTSG